MHEKAQSSPLAHIAHERGDVDIIRGGLIKLHRGNLVHRIHDQTSHFSDQAGEQPAGTKSSFPTDRLHTRASDDRNRARTSQSDGPFAPRKWNRRGNPRRRRALSPKQPGDPQNKKHTKNT